MSKLINISATQQYLYSNLPILINTKYCITIEKSNYQKHYFNGAIGDALASSEWCSVEF